MADFSLSAARTNAQGFDQGRSTVAIRTLRADAQNDNKEKAKIEKSARDFESILIGQWLEHAEKSFATVPGEDPNKKNQDAGQEQMQSIAFHSLAEGMTKAGGFGIASMISKYLEAAAAKQATASEAGLMPGKPNSNR